MSEKQPLLPSMEENPNPMSKPKRIFSLVFIVFITFMQTLTYVMTYYTVSEYALAWFEKTLYPNQTFTQNESNCEVNRSTEEYKDLMNVQSVTSKWSIYVSLAAGLPILLSGTLLSALTDNYGRKRIIVIPIFCTFLKNGLCALAVYNAWDIYLFTVFMFVEGAGGGWVTTLSVGSACIADLTKPDKSRSFMLTLMGTGIGLGFVGGTLLAGYTIMKVGYLYPLVISTILSLITVILITSLFPEPLPEHKRLKHFNPSSKAFSLVEFYVKNTGPNFRIRYILAIISLGFMEIGYLGKTTVEIFYATDPPYCLNPIEISIFASVRGLTQEIIGAVFLKIFQMCIVDEMITLFGLLSGIAYYIIEGLSVDKVMLFSSTAAGIIAALPLTLLRSIMSKMTPPDRQGSLFGSIAFFESIYNLTGNVITGAIYSASVHLYRGTVFFVLAGLSLISSILVM
ncbi:hypothetical protein FSP39_011084 [Pinctada imbricata]|uniref:Major facilitator superfamily (MFS) profile domain-containing protein n=1 Tax=Pinctada imbricata TaxID=66713 RepID=A0AA88XXN9_PINIB|nr:hypothetical protein FSP39_011084 [Pinctada imbricata]